MVYATWIQDSMAGLGTRDSDLIRLILARAEVGLVFCLFLVYFLDLLLSSHFSKKPLEGKKRRK